MRVLAIVFVSGGALVASVLFWPEAVRGSFFVMHDHAVSPATARWLRVAIASLWIAAAMLAAHAVRTISRPRS